MIADWMLDSNFEGPPYEILENDSDTSSGDESSCEEWWMNEIPYDETELLTPNEKVVTKEKKPSIFKWICNFLPKKKAPVKSQTFVSIISDEYEAMVNAMQVTAQTGIGRSFTNQEVAINPVMTGELSTEDSFHSYVCAKHTNNSTKTHRFSNTIRPTGVSGKFTTVHTTKGYYCVAGPSSSVPTTSSVSAVDDTSVEEVSGESFNVEFDDEWADLISKNQKKQAATKKPKNY